MAPKLIVKSSTSVPVAGKPFLITTNNTSGKLPSGAVKYGYSNPEIVKERYVSKATVELTVSEAEMLTITATEERPGANASGTLLLGIAPAATPPVPPKVVAIPSQLYFKTAKGFKPDSQDLVLHSGTDKPLDVDSLDVSDLAPWLFAVDESDNQVIDFVVQPESEGLEVGRYETKIVVDYVDKASGLTAQLEVPVVLEVVQPETTPVPVPPAGDYAPPPPHQLDTRFMVPLLPSKEFENYRASAAKFLAKAKEGNDRMWAQEGDSWAGNYYDRAENRMKLGVILGDDVEVERGIDQLVGYRDNYIIAANYASSPHWFQPEGLYSHFMLTRDPVTSEALARATNGLLEALITNVVRRGEGYSDLRVVSRCILGVLLCWKINTHQPTKYTPWSDPTWNDPDATWEKWLRWLIEYVLAWPRAATGSIDGGSITCNGSWNFMVGLMNNALTKVYDNFSGDPRILELVKSLCDFLMTQWRQDSAGNWGFQYGDVPGCPEGGTDVAADLTGLILTPFQWVYNKTGETKYHEFYDRALDAHAETMVTAYTKQTNQGQKTVYEGPAMATAY